MIYKDAVYKHNACLLHPYSYNKQKGYDLMTKKIKITDVPVGKSIEVFEKKFTILDHTDKGVLVLSESIETEMPFRNKCKAHVAPNDFRDSDIYQYLNGEYLDKLMNSTEDADAILDMEIDLKCTLGQREYGTLKTKAGLLTLDQYGKYFDIIPKVDDCWWLATPLGTPLRSPSADNASRVWYVRTNGDYNYNYYGCSYGVRPALILDSSLSVSCDDIPDDNTTQLSNFSDEDLLEEIARRFKT